MAITREEVLKIAALAKLRFNAAELEAFTAQFRHILDYIEKLKEVPVDDVAPTSHVSVAGDSRPESMRKDEVRPSLNLEAASKNAPDFRSDHFRVPQVIPPNDEPGGGRNH